MSEQTPSSSETPSPGRLLEILRSELQDTDAEITGWIRRRFTVIARIGEVKRDAGVPMMQPAQVTAVRNRYTAVAADAGLDSRVFREVADLLVAAACELEDRIIAGAVGVPAVQPPDAPGPAGQNVDPAPVTGRAESGPRLSKITERA